MIAAWAALGAVVVVAVGLAAAALGNVVVATVAVGVVMIGAAFVVTAHLAWRDGRLAGHAEMLDAATEYHRQRRIIEADTQPAILAVLDAQQAMREVRDTKEESSWQPTTPLTPR